MDRPNVLILWTDQQRGDALGLYNPQLHTPNLDRLAGCATVFTNAITSQPVCTPARASIMTGLWPQQHGTWSNNTILPDELRCIPEYLNNEGDHQTGHIGKWHLGLELYPQHGFDTWEGSEDDYQKFFPDGYDRSIRSPYHHWLCAHGYMPDEFGWFNRFVCCQFPEEHSKPAWTAERAIAFLASQDPGKPWILDVNTLEPHHPNTSARNKQYDPRSLDLIPGMLDPVPVGAPKVVHDKAQAMRKRGVDGKIYPDEEERRKAMARYYGLVSMVDTHYGRLLDYLHETDQFENTLIVYTSDHGEMLNQYGLWGKFVQYRGSVHIPLMIKLPGQRQMRRYEHPVGHIDILPTLLDYYGIEQPEKMTGRSLLPACHGDDLAAEDAFSIWEASGERITDPAVGVAERRARAQAWHAERTPTGDAADSVRAIHTVDGWRYSVNTAAEFELYDITNDPAEATNLAADPAYAERRKDLHARLVAWQERTEDFVTLPM